MITLVITQHLLRHELPVLIQRREVMTVSQQQRLTDTLFQMPVCRFNGAIFMTAPAVIARRNHAVVFTQVSITFRQIAMVVFTQVFPRGGQAVGAVLLRNTAQLPKRFLNTFGKRGEALTSGDYSQPAPAARFTMERRNMTLRLQTGQSNCRNPVRVIVA